MAAGVAVDAEESVGQDAALEVGADLPFHEPDNGGAFESRASEVRGKLLTDDLV